jgi:hypothetical protein
VVPVPETLLHAVLAAVPREDRNLDGQVFAGLDADALRTSLGRACKTAGVPAFSPHAVRHRRASLWQLGGMPVAEAYDKLGHSPEVHLGLYAHFGLDRREVDYASMLADARSARSPLRLRRSQWPDLQGCRRPVWPMRPHMPANGTPLTCGFRLCNGFRPTSAAVHGY